MRSSIGLSVIEIIAALAVLGILLTIGLGYLNPDRIAVSQASQVLSSQVNRARLEAIRNNTRGGIRINTSGNGSFQVWAGDIANEVVLQTITLGQGDFPRVRCHSATLVASSSSTTYCPNLGTYVFTFDARGVPQDQGRLSIVLSNFANNFQRTVCINQQGRSQVVSGTCP